MLTPSFEGGAVGPSSAPAAEARSRPKDVKTKAKRDDAARPQRRHDATKELKKRVAKLERDLATAESEVADVNRELSEPDVYQDADKVTELSRRFGEAKDRAAALMDEWSAPPASSRSFPKDLTTSTGRSW